MDSSHREASFAAGIGVGLMLGKTLIIVIGMQLLRYTSLAENSASRCQIRALGMTLAMAIGPLCEIMAYSFAPQSLLAPINGFDLVWNVFLAPLTLGERQSRAKMVGTLIVFTGACIATTSGPHSVTAVSLEELRRHFLSARFLIYTVVCFACFLLGIVGLNRRRAHWLHRHLPRKDVVRGTLIGVGGGFVTGQTYFLSSSATLVRTCIGNGNWSALRDWLPYAVLGGAVACGILSAVLMNKGLEEFEAMVFIPTFTGSSISAACVSAEVVMRQTTALPYWRMACYWFGISLVVVGLSILARDAHGRSIADLELRADADSSAGIGSSDLALVSQSQMTSDAGKDLT